MRRAVGALKSEDLFVSVISLGEIAKGIALVKDGKKKGDLEIWIRALETDHADRILPVDLETSHIWGELAAEAQKIGETVPASDGLIAATARRYGLYVMTRNTEHFKVAGVQLLDPWAGQLG